MAGISQVLSIAKEALLAHQLSVSVAAHNVANVDTPGYSRQALSLTTNPATPSSVGNIGGGVRGDEVYRYYDTFMVQRLVNQQSELGNLEAQQQSMQTVEAVFNETTGLGLNDLMNKFWTSWQDLSDNPEVLSTRQAVVQAGELLSDYLTTMNSEIARVKNDIGVNLDTAISDVNNLTQQIASLNVQISNSEGPGKHANDLRDSRDELVKELADLLDINYFENKNGAYTVLLSDGHSLVDSGEYWTVDWANNKLYWVNTDIDGNKTSQAIGAGAELGGKIGGWLEVRGQLVEGDPDNYLGRLDAFANGLIRELNQQHSQGVGLTTFTDAVIGTETADNTGRLTGTIDSTTAATSIAAGTIKINDLEVGEIRGGAAVQGLAMAKAASAAKAINNAYTGVDAKLTTLVAGNAVTPMGASPANDGDVISFDVNGITVSYTVDNDGVGTDDSDPAIFSANLAAAINAAITAYNADPTHAPAMSLEAVVGDGTNGGALNSLILRNTNPGDESRIVIANIASVPPGIESNIGLTEGTYVADATHNTGEITLFSDSPFDVDAGTDDTYLNQLGLGGGVHSEDPPDDGKFTYSYENGGVAASLQGYEYARDLTTDGAGFDIWLYNTDGTLAYSQPVTVSLERAYTLQDVADAINVSITNATGAGTPWVSATVDQNQLRLTPDADHYFAFANDTSNFLQVAGINTFFSGYSAGTMGINQTITDNLSLITAATVSNTGEILKGDNTNALQITNIQQNDAVTFTGGSTDSLDGFYNALVGDVGNMSRTISRNYDFNSQLTDQMNQMRDSVSGVSLDEEMANLIKYQNAYSAAAKLITMSDEMLVTLLDSVK